MDKKEKIQRIVNIFESGYKDKNDLRVGIELEYFIVDKKTLRSISYLEDRGVRDLLFEMKERLGPLRVFMEDGNIFSMEFEEYSISIEPGCQFEISINLLSNTYELKKVYDRVIVGIKEILDQYGYILLAGGYRPLIPYSKVEMIPRTRYKRMGEYFKEDSLARKMMVQTASSQVSIDYTSEGDFKKKYFLANAISPIIYSIFDSVHIFEGEEVLDKGNIRAMIWHDSSFDRAGVFESFNGDFSFYDYGEEILNLSPIFDIKTKELIKDTKLSQILDGDLSEKEINEYISHSLEIVFPDVRLKNYLEIRMMDSLPSKYSFAGASLIKGIFYSKDIDDLIGDFKGLDGIKIKKAIGGIINNGLESYYQSDYIINWASRLIDFSRDSLAKEEKDLLRPLDDLLSNMDTPKDIFKRTYDELGYRKAYGIYEV